MTMTETPENNKNNTNDASNSTSTTRPKKTHPIAIINAGCKTNSIDEVIRGLRLASSTDAYQSLLRRALFNAVWHGSARVTEYLLTHENASLGSFSPVVVSRVPSVELLSVLISHGWDINQREADSGAGPGKRLLDFICYDDALVRWCLEHGALVEDDWDRKPDPDPDPFKRPPLLDCAAGLSSLETFKLLQERGARLGPRTLHQAVCSAATCKEPERMKVVEYLLDQMGIDINKMDTDGKLPNHWGPPISYAAKERTGAEMVRYLLERGADPYIKDCWGDHNAFSLAEFYKNEEVMQVLREWKEHREGAGI
jgi:hypothetical protein